MIRADKSLGQNFLVSESTIGKIVEIVSRTKPKRLLEIGPGFGAVTLQLSRKIPEIIAVEKDNLAYFAFLEKLTLDSTENILLYNHDIIRFPLEKIEKPFDVFGSLPFNISKRIVQKILSLGSATVPYFTAILQKEVAEQYCTPPPRASFLYHVAHTYSTSKLHFIIPNTHFHPIPKVDSALVTFTLKPLPDDHSEYLAFVKKLFRNPRKTLKNNLSPLLSDLPDNFIKKLSQEIDLSKRPSEILTEEYKSLFIMYNKHQSNETKA